MIGTVNAALEATLELPLDSPAVLLWDGQPLRVMAEEANTEPLIGMSLLYEYKVTMETVDGGVVTMELL